MNQTIVLVDDHPIVREGLATLLHAVPGYRVVAQAGNARDGLDAVRAHRPGIAVVDLMLGDTLALRLIEEIAQSCPDTGVVCISMHSDAAYAEPAALAGALGYVNKANVSRTILDAIDSVLRGVPYFPPEVQQNLLRRARGQAAKPTTPLAALSPREIEILRMIGEGLTKQQIAERIGRSANTVEAHRTNIKRKLGLDNNAELIRFSALNLLPAPAR